MQKLILTLLVGIIAFAPALAAAQTGSSGSGTSGSSSSGSPSGTTGSGTTGSGTSTSPGTSSGSPSSPAASPSGTASDFAKYTTKADCEKAGGMWDTASNKCQKKK
jgi:hypothetical protein